MSLKTIDFFQYDTLSLSKNLSGLTGHMVPWNIESKPQVATIVITPGSPLLAYFSRQSHGNTLQAFKSVQLAVPLRPKKDQWRFVFTTPMEGCSWIIAKLQNELLIFHDRNPLNFESEKMNYIRSKMPEVIYRLDDYEVGKKLKQQGFIKFVYGSEGKEFGAHLVLQFDDQRWRLHIQDMKIVHPNLGDKQPTMRYHLAGKQRFYNL